MACLKHVPSCLSNWHLKSAILSVKWHFGAHTHVSVKMAIYKTVMSCQNGILQDSSRLSRWHFTRLSSRLSGWHFARLSSCLSKWHFTRLFMSVKVAFCKTVQLSVKVGFCNSLLHVCHLAVVIHVRTYLVCMHVSFMNESGDFITEMKPKRGRWQKRPSSFTHLFEVEGCFVKCRSFSCLTMYNHRNSGHSLYLKHVAWMNAKVNLIDEQLKTVVFVYRKSKQVLCTVQNWLKGV